MKIHNLWKIKPLKNGKEKAKNVKLIQEKLKKIYLQVITDAFVKIAVLEMCSEKSTRQSVTGAFKNICTVAVHWWYIKDAFGGVHQQIFKKRIQKEF